jgi:hypothetical protein
MIAGAYEDYRQLRMVSSQQDSTQALLDITSIGLPQ